MRITHVHITPQGASGALTLNLGRVGIDSEYVVKGVTGLDAEDITVSYDAMATSGGENSSVVQYPPTLRSRDIVFLLGLNPNYSSGSDFRGLRDKIYRLISPNRSGLLDLKFASEGGVEAYISGYITKVEAPPSTKSPEIQVTIHCPDALFKAPEEIRLINPGQWVSGVGQVINIEDYVSTAPHGLRMLIEFTLGEPNLTLKDQAETWSFVATPPGGFDMLGVVSLSSEKDNRYLKILYPSKSIAGAISPGSTWPMVFPGTTNIQVLGAAWVTDIYHRPSFWGL